MVVSDEERVEVQQEGSAAGLPDGEIVDDKEERAAAARVERDRRRELRREEREDKKARKAWEKVEKKSGKLGHEKVLPSINVVSGVRRVEGEAVEDLSGVRLVVWRVEGMDSSLSQVTNGWMTMLNSVEFPFQVLIRQHSPDFTQVKEEFLRRRPDGMRTGRINDVGNSMIDYLGRMEDGGEIVSRKWYVICGEDREMEMGSVLAQSGFDANRLGHEELNLLVQACVSGMGYGHVQDAYQVKEEKNVLELNYRFMSVFDIFKWPRRVSLLFLEQLLRTGEEMDVSIWIWPVSQRESHSRLQMQRSRFEGARINAEQKGKLVGPEVEGAIADVSRIADEVSRGVSRLFRRTMTIATYGRDRASLKAINEKVTGHFRSNIAGIRLLKYRQGRGYAAVMPTRKPGVGAADMTDSGTMQRMFPFTPHDMDRREGTFLGMDLRSRTPVLYDPFSPKNMNGHMVVMARSGAGKSFFTKLRVLREALRGVPVYLIDPEGEYGVITRALGGEVFVPGAPGHGLNPFAMGFTEEGDLAKRIASLRALVGVMLEGDLDGELKATIDRALSGFYAKELSEREPGGRLGTGGVHSFYEYLQTDVAKAFGGDRLAHLLSPFATGSSRFLMRGDARDLMVNEAPVTSFNLKNLSGALKPVAISVCAEVVWGLAVTSPRPRLLVVDECWTVLASPSGAEALITIVKRARKYQLGLMTVTQDVQDFLAENSQGGVITGHAGKSLLQNSATKLAFSQDPGALPQVVEALGLDDDVGAFLAGSLRGQGVLIGETGSVYPIEITSTVEERDLVLDDSWRQDGMNPEDEEVVEVMDSFEGGGAETGILLEGAGGDVQGLAERLQRRLERESNEDEELVAPTGINAGR